MQVAVAEVVTDLIIQAVLVVQAAVVVAVTQTRVSLERLTLVVEAVAVHTRFPHQLMAVMVVQVLLLFVI
jgi:hypothetical protein